MKNWEQLSSILDRVLDLDPADRLPFVEKTCKNDPELKASVIRFLENIDPAEQLWDKLVESESVLADEIINRNQGTGIQLSFSPLEQAGPFRVIGLIARGGMGNVYLAERSDGKFNQKVAIKLLQDSGSEKVIGRFAREREILASLNHPGIAMLLDAGTATDGRPYLVMEFVDGLPIDRYCQEARLDLTERIKLFLRVCDAVAAAHSRMIVHRDIKPSNILVTGNGDPKLLDFGIARLLEGEDGGEGGLVLTRTGQFALSPAYASPEQVRGEVVAMASDVYQLGTLLYELLTGGRPNQEEGTTAAALVRIICELDPPKPSRAVREEGFSGITAAKIRGLLRGDLDTILMKALRKQPDQRYASVPELADDLRRYLDGLPVRAHPPSRGYRLAKFMSRHRVGVVAGVLLVLGVLAGVIGLAIHGERMEAERDRARLEAERAEAVTGFLFDLFEDAGQTGYRDTLTIRALLERGEARIDERTIGRPQLRIDLLGALAALHDRMGQGSRSLEIHDERIEAFRDHYGSDSWETALELLDQGRRRTLKAHWNRAIPLLEEGIAILEEKDVDGLMGSELRHLYNGYLNLSVTYREVGRIEDALALMERASALRTRALEAGTDLAGFAGDARYAGRLAFILRGAGQFEEAEALYLEAIALEEARGGEHSAAHLNNYASLLRAMGRYEEAEERFRMAWEVMLAAIDGEPPGSLDNVTNNLIGVLKILGRHEEALAVAQEYHTLIRKTHPPFHWRMGRAEDFVGSVHFEAGAYEAAVESLTRMLVIWTETLGDDHIWVASARAQLARALLGAGRLDEAEPLLIAAYSILSLADHRSSPSAMLVTLESLIELNTLLERAEETVHYQGLLVSLLELHPELVAGN